MWNESRIVGNPVQGVTQSLNGKNLGPVFLVSESFLEKFNATNGRMEVKENCQRKGDTHNDDPRHEAIKGGLDDVGSNLF